MQKRNPALTDASSTAQFFLTVWVQKCASRAHINHKVCVSNLLKPKMKNETPYRWSHGFNGHIK
jgi:hypothetical protein